MSSAWICDCIHVMMSPAAGGCSLVCWIYCRNYTGWICFRLQWLTAYGEENSNCRRHDDVVSCSTSQVISNRKRMYCRVRPSHLNPKGGRPITLDISYTTRGEQPTNTFEDDCVLKMLPYSRKYLNCTSRRAFTISAAPMWRTNNNIFPGSS